MIAHTTAQLIDKQSLSSVIRLFTLRNPVIAREARPGQFIHIKINNCYYPLMRRPISVFSSDNSNNFQILFKIVGEGTKQLAEKNIGEEIDIISPLGNSYTINENRDILCVAGGIGIAPIYFLLLRAHQKGVNATLLFGGKTVDDILFRQDLNYLTNKLIIATEDGSLGNKGKITEFLPPYLDEMVDMYVCGPIPMVKVIKDTIGFRNINCYVSLEERMGCGLGACRGCVVNTVNGYMRVCTDGPVFNLNELVF